MQKRVLLLACFFFLGCFISSYFVFQQSAQILEKTKQTKVLGEQTKIIIPVNTPTPTLTPTPFPTPTPTEAPTPTPTPTLTPTPIPAPVSLDDLFTKYSSQYSVAKDLLQKIANCESGFNSNAANGDYQGMFQFASQSWVTNRNNMGADPNTELRLNAEESIRTAAFMIGENKTNAWPNCSR